ncbi:hypothetical protein DPMN_006751 [Dreissena polymorpha]|uniref:Uncharacterized protein n=1 Tax=Dreissena polymorpha TaxID=45954 RepID=A0A9D4MVR7_DREPO|nr:hypothetical protein DPMN_006751 [Dreissena polymorpha]
MSNLSQTTSPGMVRPATPMKAMETRPSGTPSPSPVKEPQLDPLQGTITGFCEQIDTQLKAALYSLIVNDVEDAKATMHSMRKATTAFHGQSSLMLRDAQKRSSTHHLAKQALQQYSSKLAKENVELAAKVKALEKELESRDGDVSVLFADDFDTSDDSGAANVESHDENDEPDKKKIK